MKTTTFLCCGSVAAVALAMQPVAAQNENVTRGIDVKGVDVKGADVSGGTVTGGSVTGGSVIGGSVTGGSVTGGTVTPGSVTPGLVTAFAAGREIRVRAVGPVSVNAQGETAEVKIGDQMLLIKKAKLLLDGEPLADLPAAAKKVDVEVTDERLVVKADGERIAHRNLDRHSASAPTSDPSDSRKTDRARDEAERARSEGDRLRQDAERIRQEADRLRQQADRLRNP